MVRFTLDNRFCAVAMPISHLFNLLTQMSGVVQQGLPINLSRIVKPWSILQATPPNKRLPAITVRLHRAVMPAAK